MDTDSVDVKEEIEENTFEYHGGAPSPDLPIFNLIPLSSLPLLKARTAIPNNDTLRSFDQSFTGSPPQPKTYVPDFLPSAWNLQGSSNIAANTAAVTCKGKTYKDSSTNTCAFLHQCMYEKSNICPKCKGFRRYAKEDVLIRATGIIPEEIAQFKEMKIEDEDKESSQ